MKRTSWIIKASKLCNLRCGYCYEWKHLADTSKLSLPNWRRILAAVRWNHTNQSRNGKEDHLSSVVWHGGEPLVLPVSYWKEVASLQRQILCDEAGQPLTYRTAVQTNLYAVTDDFLALFEQERMTVGVSFDGVPGVRVSLHRQETEDRVLSNMKLLRHRGIVFGGAVVLSGGNKSALPEVYRQLKEAGASYVKIIPLFKAEHFGEFSSFAISPAESIEALSDLHLYVSTDPDPIPVFPLDDCARTVDMCRLNLPVRNYDPRIDGERHLIVDTNGDLYTQPGLYGSERSLGNVLQTPLADIWSSRRYDQSLAARAASVGRICGNCVYQQSCNTLAAQSHRDYFEDQPLKKCGTKAALCDFIWRHAAADNVVNLALP